MAEVLRGAIQLAEGGVAPHDAVCRAVVDLSDGPQDQTRLGRELPVDPHRYSGLLVATFDAIERVARMEPIKLPADFRGVAVLKRVLEAVEHA